MSAPSYDVHGPDAPILKRVRTALWPDPVTTEALLDRRTMAFSFALLYGAGGAMVLFSLLLPHDPGRHVSGLLGVGCLALVIAATMLSVGRRFPMWVFRSLPLLGSILVSLVAYSGGPSAVAAYALFYVWVVLSAFYFFPGKWGVINLVWVGITYAPVVAVTHSAAAELKWVMLMGTQTIAALLLTMLQDYVRRAGHEREQLLARVEQLASTDPLTGLANRRAWDDRLGQELQRALRQGSVLSVVLIDLDGLKEINDSGGHSAGDRAITSAASGWRGVLRDPDFLARLAGDEFGVLLPDCPQERALEVVERLRESTTMVEWSAGIAVWSGDEPAEMLVKRADRVLFRAKRGGRGLALVAEPSAA